MADTSLAMLPWFPRDFLASTRAMRLAERGAYRELLDYQWEMGVLPADHDRLARLLGVDKLEFADLWPAISHKFEEVPGGLQNQRLEQHRKKALEQRDKKRKAAADTNAKRGGKRGAERDGERAQRGDSLPTLSGTPPSPSPSVKEKNPPTPLRGGAGSHTRARKSRDLRAASNTAWSNVTEGAARSHARAGMETADPVLAAAVSRLGGWSRFGQSTAIGSLKAPFREAYEQLLEQQHDDFRAAAAS